MALKQQHLLKHSFRGLAVLGALCASVPAAGYFYTIIGPDGHPIVVQQKQPPKKQPAPQAAVQQATVPQPPAAQQPTVQPAQQPKAQPLQSGASPQPPTAPPAVTPAPPSSSAQMTPSRQAAALQVQQPKQQPAVQQKPVPQVQPPRQTAAAQQSVAPGSSASATFTAPRRPAVSVLQPQHSSEMSQVTAPGLVASMPDAGQHVILSASPSKTTVDPNAEKNFTEIDGERYVDAEYLEQREFNLEGKKRFYVMPEVGGSGTHRMQTVEREKGITASILGAWRNKDPLADLPKALAPQYHRMPQQEVVDALEQSCFAGKKIDKAKTLSHKNRDIGFWPVAPISDNFSYEVARIDANIDEILFTSYASSQKIPTYYWPLVVFLDQQGCVIEGVSGFKNQQAEQSKFQYASLEGVLKKPQGAVYLFVTPLASAIDLDASQLSNQGQFKLSVIR